MQGLREERGNLIGEKETLIEQINVRDHIIQDSMGQRETLVKDLAERDCLIQDLIGQRETLMNDIEERDHLYRGVTEQNVILANNIKALEKELAELKQSFLGHIKNALLKGKK